MNAETPYTEFIALDAGEQREALALSLLAWHQEGFWSLPRRDRFRACLRHLARSLGRTTEEVLAELGEDADWLLACDGEEATA